MSGQKKSKVKLEKEDATIDLRSQMILQTSIDGFCIMNLKGKLLYVNPALCKITGYSEQELLAMEIKDLEAKESPKQVARHSEKTQKKGYDRFQTRHRCKNGKILDIEVSVQYCKFGKDEFFFSFFRDIAPNKQAEKKLLASERIHRTLCNNIPGMVYKGRTDWSTEIIANSKQIAGYDIEEFNSKKILWPDLIVPEDKARVLNEVLKIERKPVSIVQEYRIITKDGSIRWLEDHKTSRFTKAGFDGVDGVVFDITARKFAEDETRKFKNIADKANYGVAISNLDGILTYVNKYFAAVHGYTVEELLGKSLSIFHNPAQLKLVQQTNRRLKKLSQINAIEIKHTHKDGTVFPMLMNPQIINDENNQPLYMATTAIDINEQKKAEAERQFYKEKVLLAQKYAYVDSMGTIVAHQVNQPLTVINMLLGNALEQLQGQSCPPSVIEKITQSLEEAKNAASIINKFRQSSKDTHLSERKPINLEQTANEIISVLSEKASTIGMNISVKGVHNLADAEIDEAALEQIFFNIIQNAIEAVDGKKQYKLDISAKATDGKIELIFSDNCRGIDKENLENIFEPFFTTKKDGKGMGLGLGLEIVKHVLLGCNGEINVESKLGKGTKFYVSLPAKNDKNL